MELNYYQMNKSPETLNTPASFQKHEMLLDIMKMFNSTSNQNDMFNTMLGILQSHTGIESVALRVKLNNDYPYIASRGFSENFIQTERFLACTNTDNSELQQYECICGLLLDSCNRPSNSCFSAGGSFRVNSSDDPDLAALMNSGNRRFRAECFSEGYNSIALIPISSQNEIVAIFQFNDRKKGVFTEDLISFLESCAEALGLALHRKSIESGIFQTNRYLETIIEERTIELLKTIKDKDRLLDEVNHRIKNNLLIISSLLNLQVMKESNQHIRDALNGALIRINSMGIIHQRLYSSSDLENIDIEDYLVALYNKIILTYTIAPASVEFILKCNGVSVNIDTAIPCGLIVNEILSNSVKHGIVPGKKLVISIIINRKDNIYNMLISDNGPGLKPDFNSVNDGNLGMELIRALVKQLDGTIDFYNNDGLVCDIRINEENKEENRWKQKTS